MQNHLENKAYAGFFVRLAAFAVDSLLAAIMVGIVKLPFSIAAMGGAGFLKANFIFNYTVLDVISYVGVAAYFILLTYFAHSTPGKMLFRLEVVTQSGNWTFLNILYRETVGRFLSSLLCVGYLAVLVQKEKQGFHDMLCDTYVVYKNMVAVPDRIPLAATGVGAVSPQREAVKPSGADAQSSVEPAVSAFQMEEGHPVLAEAPSEKTFVSEQEVTSGLNETEMISKSYDNMNPDCTNLDIDSNKK